MTKTRTQEFGPLTLTDHVLSAPLDWENPGDGRMVDVFARVVTRGEGADKKPYLFYLQGGPGGESPRPSYAPVGPAWLDVALDRYQVVLLDQRGTGHSTPVGDEMLREMGDAAMAEYLTHHRADAIVRDCEMFREYFEAEKITTLGQSFGGFTTVAYLSKFADSLEKVFFTGGLTAVGRKPEEAYALCYDKMRAASERYYRQFPGDRDRVRELLDYAAAGEIVLPNGDKVSPARLRNLGHLLGGDNGWLSLHWLLERDHKSNAFRHGLSNLIYFGGDAPLYFVLHESCYADGYATNWAAMRAMPQDFKDDYTLLTGEHVDPAWMDESSELAPWKNVTETLAKHEWGKLYDADALRASNAQGAAAVYYHDVYVPIEYSMETAALMPGIKTLVTSEFEHGGLGAGGPRVFSHLLDLADGKKVR
ncbi:MAG: alpha/beta fold hydrolase [Microbacteriaceae bacterium]|nr:alpha/beta fold hydrolase [Microbacteriaceae bacterium]